MAWLAQTPEMTLAKLVFVLTNKQNVLAAGDLLELLGDDGLLLRLQAAFFRVVANLPLKILLNLECDKRIDCAEL